MRKKSFFRPFLWMACLLPLLLLTACTSQPTLDTSEPPTIPTIGKTPAAHTPSFPEGKVLFTYKGHQQRGSDGRMRHVTEIQWSPDGKRIASSDGVTLDIWDALTGEHAFRVPLKSIGRFTWSPDNRYIATTESKTDSSIQIWDTTTNKIKLVLAGKVNPLVAPVWSPDGKYIAASDLTRKTVQIWNPASGKILFNLASPVSSIQLLAWAPDSQRLAKATWNNIQILSIPSGKVLATNPLPLTSAIAASWSPDGKQLTTTTNSPGRKPAIAIWSSATGKLVSMYTGYDLWPSLVQFSPDGKRLLVVDGYVNPQVQIRDVATGNFIFSYTGVVHGLVSTAAWSPDGKYITSSDENTIQVWSATPGREMLTYLGLSSLDGNGDYGVAALAYAPNGQYIVASGDDKKKTIQVWSAKNGAHILTRSGVARSLAWSPNSALIASAQTDNTIYIWNALTGQQLLAYKGHQTIIQKVSWSPDGKSLVSADIDGHIQIWDASTGHLRTSLTDPRRDLFALALSPDGHFLVEGGSSLNVWNLATGKIVYTYKGQSTLIYAASWSPDSKRIASASYDQTVQVWDATTGGHPLTYRNHHEKVFLVAWSPDGKYLVSASSDLPRRSIQVWNASTGKTVVTYDGVLSNVSALDWAPDSTAIALGGLQTQDINIVQLWHPF
ncbi:WD40 repeat domain-containing protein [Dictyobacter formicarum]|uniref:Translation initiation factor beta propellor-like domain-containing protein n=1 Tax=Dictyobacter formicarum TaxID=2778368 RepID=A0ABQ3VH81_9CHLR|nr:WD40 repeat domain-containing protein [Dictyobacter formicarum]GHO84723.1 hypothetical protein KSZ_27290 [Dictyobacter formicarum]